MDDENETESKSVTSPDSSQGGFNVSVQITDVLGLGRLGGHLKPASQSILNGIGAFFATGISYIQARADGAADRHNALADAKLLAKLDREVDEATSNLIRARFLATEVRRNKNILDTVESAVEQSEATGSGDAFEIDQDFMVDWIDGVQDVSAKEVQAFWAAMLAKAPQNESGRVSKPAMNLLREFDQQIANSFLNFLRLAECCGPPSTRISAEGWKECGFEIDIELLEDVRILSRFDDAPRFSIEPFKVEQTPARSSNAGFSLLPTLGVWAPTRRARELADFAPNIGFTTGEDLTAEVLEKNLTALSDDKHHHLKLTAETKGIIVSICQSPNGFGQSAPSESGEAVDSQIGSFSKDIPNKFGAVFRKFASESRLRIEKSKDEKEADSG